MLISAGPFSVQTASAQNSVVVARGVQTGTLVFGNGGGTQVTTTGTATLGTPVDSSKAFVHCSFSTSQGGPNVHPTCVLSDTQVTITIGAAAAASAHTTVRWYVVEFEGVVTVQRGTANFATGATEPGGALVSLTTAVDCAKSFVLITERMNTTATNIDEEWQANATLTGSGGAAPRAACTVGTTSSLELFRGRTGVVLDVAWQVIQIEGISVQRGRSCIGDSVSCPAVGTITQGSTQNATISLIDTAKSFVLTTQRAGTGIGGNEGDYRVRTDFSTTTQLRFTRFTTNTNTADVMSLTWEVVALKDTGRVERNAFASPASLSGASLTTSNFTSQVSQARTIPFFSSSHDRSNTGDYATTAIAVQVNQLNLTFTHTNARTETIAWQAVEFFGCNTDPTLCHVSVSALSGTTADSASVRISWWPVLYASGNQCFSATSAVNVSPPTCNVMVARATFAAGQTPSDIDTAWLSNGTSYTQGVLSGGGACTPTNGSVSNPCIVHDGAVTASAVATFATDCWASVAPCPGGTPNLKNDGTTYVYRVFVRSPSGCGSPPCWVSLATSLSQVSVTPKIRNGPNGSGLQWIYQPSGGAVLNSPIADTNNRLYASSTNNKILTIDTSTGAELSLPVVTPAKVSGYPAWWPLNPPAGTQTQVIVGDESGYVTSFDGATGKRLWTRRIHTDPEDSTKGNIQAAVVVQTRNFSNTAFQTHYTDTYGYSGDVVFAGTRNTTPGGGPTANQNKRNKVYALRATDGSYLWSFDPSNASGDCNPQLSMDIIVGTPWVDYDRNSLYLTSDDGPTAGQDSLWILDTRGPTSGPGASATCRGTLQNHFGTILDNEFTIWQSYDASTFYFQTTPNCFMYAFDANSQVGRISDSTIVGGGGCLIKGSVWQDYNKHLQGKKRFYFVTAAGGVWCLDDGGNLSFARCPIGEWPSNPIYQHSAGANGVASGATPLAAGMLLEPHLWFGGGDNGTDHFGMGTIFQLSTTNGAREKTFALDSTITLGDMSVSATSDALFVGSTARIYRINLDANYVCVPACTYGSLP